MSRPERNCAFLILTTLPVRSHQQVGLSAQKSRDLNHVGHLAHRISLPSLVDVGEDAQSVAQLDIREHLQSFLQSRSAEGLEAGTVSLVERGLEDDVNAILLVDAHQLLGHSVQEFG